MTNHEIKELISILKKEGCNSKKQAIEYLEGKLLKVGQKHNNLKELVDKAIPKKTSWSANNKGITFDCCPNCNTKMKRLNKYCFECGQALDLGDDND